MVESEGRLITDGAPDVRDFGPPISVASRAACLNPLGSAALGGEEVGEAIPIFDPVLEAGLGLTIGSDSSAEGFKNPATNLGELSPVGLCWADPDAPELDEDKAGEDVGEKAEIDPDPEGIWVNKPTTPLIDGPLEYTIPAPLVLVPLEPGEGSKEGIAYPYPEASEIGTRIVSLGFATPND